MSVMVITRRAGESLVDRVWITKACEQLTYAVNQDVRMSRPGEPAWAAGCADQSAHAADVNILFKAANWGCALFGISARWKDLLLHSNYRKGLHRSSILSSGF